MWITEKLLRQESEMAAASTSRRQFLRLTLGGVSAAALASCSNFQSSSSSGSGSAGGGTFTFTFWGTGAEKDAVNKVVNQFCQSKGLTPRPQNIPGDYETKLNTLIAANTPPDAGYLTESMAMRLGEQGKIVSVAGKSGFTDYLPATLHHWAPDKAVSQTAVEVIALWYDADAAGKAGVTPPATSAQAWDFTALAEAADKLTADDNGRRPSDSGFDAKKVKRYGVAAPTTLPVLVALLKSNGVDLFDAQGTKTNIDSPQAIQVLQNVADLIFKHRVAPTPAQATTFGASTALLLGSKRVAMAMDGQWALLDLGQAKGLTYDVGVLPRFQTPLTCIIGGASGVFASSKNQDAAMELLIQMGDPTKVPLYANGLWMPMQKKFYTDQAALASWVNNDVHPKGYKTAVVDPTLDNPVPYPSYKIKNFTSTISTTLNNGLNALFTKQTDIAAAVKSLASRVNQQMQGAYPDVIG
jgi:multiple sugar transport system substrate-binding protein